MMMTDHHDALSVPAAEEFIMTIDSDQEFEDLHESSDEEEPEEDPTAVILSKEKKRALAVKKKQQTEAMAESFEFEHDHSSRTLSGPVSSWDAATQGSGGNPLQAPPVSSIKTSLEILQEKIALKRQALIREDPRNDLSSTTHDATTRVEPGHEHSESVAEEEDELQQAVDEHLQDKKSNADADEEELERQKADAYFSPSLDEELVNGLNARITSFQDLALSRPLLRAISAMGYTCPTPIQRQAIPMALTGKDICASAQTGSGKTAAFLLPCLERLLHQGTHVKEAKTRVLILCPVRELASQCQVVCGQLCRFTNLSCALVVGGLPLRLQASELQLRPDIVVATPGRMIDHLRNTARVHLDALEILILDEADRLLELGFMDEISELLRLVPRERQTMVFSATMTSKVDQLIGLSMKSPLRIRTDPLYDVASNLVQEFVRIRPQREDDREAILLALCTRTFTTNTIVFLELKKHAHRMMILFGLAGIAAAELHGDLDQRQRQAALDSFRLGQVDILLCTDVAARGIDVPGVHAVINYEMPKDLTTYVHRVGRTARAGRTGRAVTLTSESRRLIAKQVARHCLGVVKSRRIPPQVISSWTARILHFEASITDVLAEEMQDKKMRMAERELVRAQNLVTHREEILARPARTWFQSEDAKTLVKQDSKARVTLTVDQKQQGMSRQQKRRDDFRHDEQSQQTDHVPLDVFTEASVPHAARFSKKERHEAEKRKRQESIADKFTRRQEEQRAKKQQKLASSGFQVDLDAPAVAKHPPASQRFAVAKEYEFKEKITSLRKQGKKGHASFKSKKRFNRRK